ncbi:MAG: hypothetical protein HPY58_14175 [Firmicutes bacterium]|nr:hypothetical protein [Bacillota bacterium]NPV30759.1 hypothetical protein [Bacillota bacterium]
MFNKRNPSKEELAAQQTILLEHLAAMGLKPEDVPQAMQELHRLILADLKRIHGHYKNLIPAAS